MNDITKWNLRSNRKATGGLLKRHAKKKRYQRGRDFVPTHIGENKKRVIRVRGGNSKTFTLSVNDANVSANGKIQKTKILSVVENAADSQFVRRNIITKGAIIATEMGKARVTSRPGQHGTVDAVLVKEKK